MAKKPDPQRAIRPAIVPGRRPIDRLPKRPIDPAIMAAVAENIAAKSTRRFLEAARAGDADVLRDCLSGGVSVNTVDPFTGGTALHHAAAYRARSALEVLLADSRIDTLARDRLGRLAFELCPDPGLARFIFGYHVTQAKREGVRLRMRQ